MTDRKAHDLAHEFSNWNDTRLIHWEPQDKPFISFKNWMKASFAGWAKIAGLPREHWRQVFKEYMKD